MGLTESYKVKYPPKYQLINGLSEAHKIFSETDNILGHKETLNKYKTIEITSVFYLIMVE